MGLIEKLRTAAIIGSVAVAISPAYSQIPKAPQPVPEHSKITAPAEARKLQLIPSPETEREPAYSFKDFKSGLGGRYEKINSGAKKYLESAWSDVLEGRKREITRVYTDPEHELSPGDKILFFNSQMYNPQVYCSKDGKRMPLEDAKAVFLAGHYNTRLEKIVTDKEVEKNTKKAGEVYGRILLDILLK